MKHNRETINAKLRAAKTGRGTFHAFVNEIEAFFKELQQLQQTANIDMTVFELIGEILGENQQ